MQIQAQGHLLTASEDDRTLTYKLLPFGEPGRTNVGTITVEAGAVTVPEDVSGLAVNLEHEFKKPVGRFTSVTETEDGLEATIRVARTRDGDDALTLASEGLRTGISVEIDSPVIKAGRLIAGTLTGAGLVVRPAFENALLTASDMGEDTDKDLNMENENTTVVEQAAPLHAGETRIDLGKVTFEAASSGASVQAALADLVPADDPGKVYIKDQEVGELFEARKSERKFVEAVGVKPLTSLTVAGKRKDRTFKVAAWAASKAELPTGKFTTSQETWKASAKAVAVDIAMELIEFGDESVISDLYEQAVDSYVEQTETELVEYVAAEATSLTAPGDIVATVNSAAAQLGAIGARMDIVVCAPDVYADLMGMKVNDAPWWLSGSSSMNIAGQSANVGGITITTSQELEAGQVLVADKRAISYHESKDFRYRALDVAHGGVDVSLIKFKAAKVTDPGSVLLFSAVAEPVA
ncbi:hypothetical protein M3D43_011485 [Micrococcus luteus]|nr:hypothetical protein [Micrococcus luteus]